MGSFSSSDDETNLRELGSCDAVRLHNFTSFIHTSLEGAQRLVLFKSRSEEFRVSFPLLENKFPVKYL